MDEVCDVQSGIVSKFNLPHYKLYFMKTETCWHAVYTRPKWEKKVADAFSKMRIESYCPMNKVVRQWADRKKILYTPLFTSYVFLKISEPEFVGVKQTEGVLRFVYWLGKPAIIRDVEIEAVKSFLNSYSNIKLEKILITESDLVRVVEGPLSLMEGTVVEVKTNSVKIKLPSLGCALTAEVAKTNVEVIQKYKSAFYKGA